MMNFTRFVEKLTGLTNPAASAEVDLVEDSQEAEGDSAQGSKGPRGDDEVKANQLKVLKKGPAMRVIFFYPGEEGTYVDNAQVTLYENGIIHIASQQEETTTHLQNCEILWRFEVDGEDRVNKVRLLKPKSERGSDPLIDGSSDSPEPPKPGKGPSKTPELN